MSIWVIVLLGPLVAILAGYGLLKGASLLSALPANTFTRFVRVSEGFTLLLVTAVLIAIVAGLVFLWRISPWATILGLAVLIINGTGVWTLWGRHRPPEDERRSEW